MRYPREPRSHVSTSFLPARSPAAGRKAAHLRREFLKTLGFGSVGALFAGGEAGQLLAADIQPDRKPWQPVSERKVRVGIVGYGQSKFGAAFGFQDHPNVEVVAVSDLIPERRDGLAKACRCDKTYESLETLVKAPRIEAVFVATDAPSHARHCLEVLNHGKHVMCAVPAIWGSIEDGEQLLEAVKRTGLKYMMAETSCFHAANHAMRVIYQAGGFGRIVFSEGEYFHYVPTPIPSYKDWRVGSPPLWYPTHATAYYVGVTGKRFTSVSCVGFRGKFPAFQPGANRYHNSFTDEFALFQTSEGGVSRMCMSKSIQDLINETGRVFGERGWMDKMQYRGAMQETLPDTARPGLPPGVPEGGHGGSHGNLTQEFISAILQDREQLVNIYEALAMTVPGIVAHQSALKDGERLKIPQFERSKA
jgi:predicted dehydrogenase